MKRRLLPFLFSFILFPLLHTEIQASEIYQYTDEKGVMHFTDNPLKVPKTGYKEIATQGTAHPRGANLLKTLEEKLKPGTDVERAVMATVRVESPMGIGTGFFVSDRGHILTNRHVLQGNREDTETQRQRYREVEHRLKRYEGEIRQEENRLARAYQQIRDYEARISRMPADQRERARENLKDEKQNIEEWERYLKEKRQEYRQVKEEVDQHRRDFEWQNDISLVQKQVKIGLADGSFLQAAILRVSQQHDLALLHLEGYAKTPKLETASPKHLPRGTPLYAIGNPAGLRHSVVNGILSGMEGTWVKTNAKIYPGNSGGPLITKTGAVVGVNTFKQLTHKFEGLGFALDIDVAMADFSDAL